VGFAFLILYIIPEGVYMNETIRCQSCGMPLGEGFWGTNADGSKNETYCTYCYANGAFTVPDLTLEGAIDASVHHMMGALKFDEAKARQLANETIPQLARWKTPTA
jgi:hypothetical protein